MPHLGKSARLCRLKRMQNTSEGSVCDTGGAPQSCPHGCEEQGTCWSRDSCRADAQGWPQQSQRRSQHLPAARDPPDLQQEPGAYRDPGSAGLGELRVGPGKHKLKKSIFFFFFAFSYKL